MPATIQLHGSVCTIEKLPTGNIRVTGPSPQTLLHGAATAGEIMYEVHPCQQRQYEELDAQLPAAERGTPAGCKPGQKPWWSLSAGERAGLRE
jgi:hypothetical protein